MNKTITITLGGQIFHIEEDAYQKLSQYLEQIRQRLSKSADKEEILTDIESGIAEKFLEKISSAKQAVSMADVEDLILVMGTADDFGDEVTTNEEKEEERNETKNVRKLYRNPDDMVIAGVCSGLGSYFGVDAVLVRLIFLISIFFGGSGVIVYVLMWLIVPEAKTNLQKLEMQGDPVTLAGIEQAVKKNIEKIQKNSQSEKFKSSLRRLVELPFLLLKLAVNFVKKIFGVVGPVFRIICGLALALVTLACLTALSFVAGALMFNLNNPYLISDIPVADIARGTAFYLGVSSVYLVVAVPLLVFLLLGVSLLRRKNALTLAVAGIFMAIWMLAVITLGASGFKYAPMIQSRVSEAREKPGITKYFEANNFQSINADGYYDVSIRRGDVFSVKASGNARDVERLKAEVRDGVLHLDMKERHGFCLVCLDFRKTKIEVIMPELKAYQANGRANFDIQGFTGKELKAELSDSSHSVLVVNYENIFIDQKDASRLTLKGTSTNLSAVIADMSKLSWQGEISEQASLKIRDLAKVDLVGRSKNIKADLDGTSRLLALKFPVEKAIVKVVDFARAEINASSSIQVSLSDAGHLSYYGSAKLDGNNSDNENIKKLEKIDIDFGGEDIEE